MNNADSSVQRPPLRRAAFALIAAVIPVAFFVLAELALRAGGFGAHYPLFIDHPQQSGYRLANPEVIKRYFGDADSAPGMQIETVFFRSDKPSNGVRIVVQGGSSAAGFPYGLGASLTGMLEQRLRRVYPNRPIEVIGTAMSAVNSYTLLDFADEIIDVDPDAVLIYAGHNEYLGILGVGSAFLGGHSRPVTRAYIALRRLRLFQLLQKAYLALAPGEQGLNLAAAQAQGTMMSRIAANKNIAYESAVYRQGMIQFERNLRALVQRYRDAGIAVFVGTLVSNEKDQPPFVSGLSATTDVQAWRQRHDTLRAALVTQPAAAVDDARALVALDERSADAWFALGQAAASAAVYDEARYALQAARDRDELRFRAPGSFNEIVAATGQLGATVVAVDAALRAEAPEGILGASLLLEHVHPTLRGYFLLADAFYDAVTASGLVGEPFAPVDDAQAWEEVPVSEVDRLFGEYKVALIKSNWPFTEHAGRPELPSADSVPAQLAQRLYRQSTDWTTAHRQLATHYRSSGAKGPYTRVALILADAFPFRASLQYEAGVALIEAGRARQALNYLHHGATLAPRDINTLLALSHALVLNRAPEQALAVLDRVLVLDPGNATARRAIRQLRPARSNPD